MCIFSFLFVFLFLSPPLQTLVPASQRDGLISLVFVLVNILSVAPRPLWPLTFFFLKSPTQTTRKFKRTRKFKITKEKNNLDRDGKKHKMNKRCANQGSFSHYLLKTAEQSQSIYYQTPTPAYTIHSLHYATDRKLTGCQIITEMTYAQNPCTLTFTDMVRLVTK